jgi:hypothetical protein
MSQLKRKAFPGFSPKFVKDETGYNYAKLVNKPFGVIESVLDWCKEELVEEWRWQLVEVSSDRKPGEYIFYFINERDYLAFILKWG